MNKKKKKKKKAKKQTHFDEDWLTDQEFGKWSAIMKGGNTKHWCQVCTKINYLLNMGRTALSGHQLGKKIFFSTKKVTVSSPVVDIHHSSISWSSQQTIIMCKGVPAPLFKAPTPWPSLPYFLKSLFPLPSFLFPPLFKVF